MALDDHADDRQAQAAARRHGGAGAGGVHLVEPIEDARQVLGRDAGPRVVYADEDLVVLRRGAHIDEADLGAIAQGQPVRFTVDAYPGQSFDGRVEQLRLNPTIEQDVVTYAAIISAPNPEFRLPANLRDEPP